MKQQALELGAVAPPEIDYDKSRFAMPEDMPEQFPDPVDDLKRVAVRFCRAFANCKTDEALRNNGRQYTDTLAIFRQRGIPVATAWRAFFDAVASQDYAPLFRAQSKKALAYLPNGRRTFTATGPRVDSCGCPLPEGVTMPRLDRHDTAHWDGDEFIIGSDKDPK